MERKTYKDLFEFISNAERDEFGYHKLTECGFPDYSLHIYNGFTQVNIVDYEKLARMNILFLHADENGKPAEVKVVECSRPGYCDYNRGVYHDIDDVITGPWSMVLTKALA